MTWTVLFHPEFVPELAALPPTVAAALANAVEALEVRGPQLGRPLADRLEGSAHTNMKELRVAKSWRFAFAFDPERQAVVLVGGDKAGVSQDRFYRGLISKADARFTAWMEE